MKKFFALSIAAILFTACQMKGSNSNETTQQQTSERSDSPAEGTAVGCKYIDFSLPGIQGNDIAVSDYVSKNRYTLVDFWASWCAPCRAEMPTIVKAYAAYHSKGLEVVGVSLDSSRDSWLVSIEQLGMTWPQMSDLKGWSCQGAKLYNVQSIPANLLIDQQGIIVAKDLRGEELLQKVAELLNQ